MSGERHVDMLMAWHPSADAGVRIPFKDSARPLEHRIETPLIERLRDHAHRLAAGEVVPRVILLVGGSGNGKTDAIEAYIEELDGATGASGKLLDAVRRDFFSPGGLPSWLVELDVLAEVGSDLGIGRLFVLQDASASQDPAGDAATRLVDLLHRTIDTAGQYLLVACINRGLLNRALKKASGDALLRPVVELVNAVARACSEISISGPLPSCWPLALPSGHPLAGTVATWPLDMESLLSGQQGKPSAFDQIFDVATAETSWNDACGDCDANRMCPFQQNASWLRGTPERDSLRRLLRDFEVVTGARWTFRQLFGLAAELLVGHPSTFGGQSPCDWARDQQAIVTGTVDGAGDAALLALLRRLYPFVLFPLSDEERRAARQLAKSARDGNSVALKEDVIGLLEVMGEWEPPAATHLQGRLAMQLAPKFDPARRGSAWNDSSRQELERVFEACDVTIENGVEAATEQVMLSELERILLERLATAEQQVDTLQRSSSLPRDTVGFLRSLAATLLARGVGARVGIYALRDIVDAYEQDVQQAAGLRRLTREEFPRLIAPPDGRLRFDLLETFGPQAVSDERRFKLVARSELKVSPAPIHANAAGRPPTGLPSINVHVRYVPLTFDLFLALRERSKGRAASSESAAIRAALGQLRVLIAGRHGRDTSGFEEWDYWYEVGEEHEIKILDPGGMPVLVRKESA